MPLLLYLRQLFLFNMTTSKSLSSFNRVLDTWEQALDQYSEEELLRQPDADSWSMGQVYVHLLKSTQHFHLKQAEACMNSEENAGAFKTFRGIMVYYVLGGMPSIKIKVPPSPQYTPPQPDSKAALKDGLAAIRPLVAETAQQLNQFKGRSGKTQHPAFGYLNAKDWFCLVEMHWRHHLQQKGRLDQFLEK